MKTAFVILTYNRPDALMQVLQGLAKQCTNDHEVIIADDGSDADTRDILRSDLPEFNCRVTHIWHPDVGFTASRARNLGACLNESDYLVFLDGDCIPNPQFVDAHVKMSEIGFFINGSRVLLSDAFTKKVLTGGVDIHHAGTLDWLQWRMNGDVNKLAHLLYLPGMPLRKERRFRWKQIRSCNFSISKADFLRVNGFDESFQGWGHEDADLVLRLHNAGVHRKNGFCATEVYHLWHKENSRANESANKDRVVQRLKSGLVRATKGVEEVLLENDAIVTVLN